MRLIALLVMFSFGAADAGARHDAKPSPSAHARLAKPTVKHSQALTELGNIIATGKPTVEPSRAGRYQLDPSWNSNRVWLAEVDEKGTTMTIRGGAADTSDVEELLKRLALSREFADVAAREFTRKGDAYDFVITATALHSDPNGRLVVTKGW